VLRARRLGYERLAFEVDAAGMRLDGVGDFYGSAAVVSTVGDSATASRAVSSDGGRSLPRLSARRRMPRQAVALKKYRCGTSPVSKISDNEDATAALWNSKVLSVKHSVGEPKSIGSAGNDSAIAPSSAGHSNSPLCKGREEDGEGPTVVGAKYSGDVLPSHPSGAREGNHSMSQSCKFDGELTTLSSQSCSEAGNAEVLAWGSCNCNVDWSILVSLECGKVADVRRVRQSVF
jgi:hypothetical protein